MATSSRPVGNDRFSLLNVSSMTNFVDQWAPLWPLREISPIALNVSCFSSPVGDEFNCVYVCSCRTELFPHIAVKHKARFLCTANPVLCVGGEGGSSGTDQWHRWRSQ